ncbi:hypothetical protein [Rathayibacter rathayi]|uniref:hypothetical protein n=1 Tax=Rathayibacter rathayi TaxID=33887 RepID=UPI000CE81A12|nr:hypothetical protein [Rathayibacter rathayi]PPF51858.1 hypothetical protein C5C08_00415 [Rathayibacter rathayi]
MRELAVSFQPLHVQHDCHTFPGAIGVQLEQVGFDVVSLDTCAAFEDGATTIGEVADYWRAECPQLADASLLLGNALGGVVAHELRSHLDEGVVTFTVSAPSGATERLRSRFAAVITVAAGEGVAEAAGLLERFAGGVPAAQGEEERRPEPAMRRRLLAGLQALTDYRCGRSQSEGRHITVVGSKSRLAGRDDVCRCDAPTIVELGGAGMRPHLDQSDRVARVVSAMLKKELR